MRKILVPTDFSELSDNALDYAVQLARRMEAELLLLHTYLIPLFPEDSAIITTEEYLREEALYKLEKLKRAIAGSAPGLQVSYDAHIGITTDIIPLYAREKHADLIVVGAQGAGYLRERILGSIASNLIRKVQIPLMVIDKHVVFKEPRKIVLAVDFAETDNQVVLKPLKQLAAKFQSHICILNIFSETTVVPSFGEISESFRLENTLKHTHHTFFEVEHPDIVIGINDFVKKHTVDMVAIISRKHSLISRIFREPLSSVMTFHSRVPLLVLQE